MTKTVIIILGPQGSGKGTQAGLLAKKLKAPIVEAGEILRREINQKTLIGLRIKKYVAKGMFVPEGITQKLVSRSIRSQPENRIVIIDGYPRTMGQKELADQMFLELTVKRIIVVYIKLEDKEATLRLLKRKRFDDQPALILSRLKKYHQETDPVIARYRMEDKLLEVDGSPQPDIVSRNIIVKVNALLP